MSALPFPAVSRLLRALVLSCASAVALLTPAFAETLLGRCVRVTDGDTCTLLLADAEGGRQTAKIRFHAIDAPESHQAYGKAAKKFVSDLIFGKDIRVETQGCDRYGRLIGRVYVNDTDVNLAIVKAGYAWWFRKYAANEPAIAAAEEAARSARRGLWQKKDPVAPWDFRRKKRESRAVPAAPAPSDNTDDTERHRMTESTNDLRNRRCQSHEKSRGRHASAGTGNNGTVCGGAQ